MKNELIDRTAIPNDTIMVLDPDSGAVKSSWGAGMFYMPHGLTIDSSGNTYVTDVGLHQVLRVRVSRNKCRKHYKTVVFVFSFLPAPPNRTSLWEWRSCPDPMRSTCASPPTWPCPRSPECSLSLTATAIAGS